MLVSRFEQWPVAAAVAGSADHKAGWSMRCLDFNSEFDPTGVIGGLSWCPAVVPRRCPVGVPSVSRRCPVGVPSARFDSALFDLIRSDSAQFDSIRFDSSRFGPSRLDSIRFDSARFHSIRFDSARVGSIRFGSSRSDSIRFVMKVFLHKTKHPPARTESGHFLYDFPEKVDIFCTPIFH